jgi:diguanylate cyclase (GGDEF)-like protein
VLTYAIGFVQDVQLTCFAVILVCMALGDRANRSLRWLAFAYVAGFGGALLDLASHFFGPRLSHWFSLGLVMEAPVVGYACLFAAVAAFVRRGERARWLCFGLAAATLPFFLAWSHPHTISRSATLQDGILAVDTALAVVLLFSASERETRLPRRTLAAFLAFYSVVEFARVAVFLIAHQMPARVSPALETTSAFVYVVACSVLPLGFIWMMNARLLVHLNRQSMIDPLTELLNRRGLHAAAELELARHERSGRNFAVVVLDLDHFKQLNDRFGHAGGDTILCEVSVLLLRMLRETDVIGRFGGEEFVLLLPDADARTALIAVERLRLALSEHPFRLGTRSTRITASFGVTLSAGRLNLSWERLQHEADLALYAAKRDGRNLTRLYDEAIAAEASGLA